MEIPYGKQSISWRDRFAVYRALANPYLTTGPLVTTFEKKLAEITGSQFGVVTLTSGTAALHAGYCAAGLGQGDEVITTPLSFVATASTASISGARIVFADVQDDTGNIDPEAVASQISSRTRFITAVDYAGHPADLDELATLAKKSGAIFMEDAAHSLGSFYRGRPVGSDADLVAFSFFPTKNMTTAEGGAVGGSNEQLISRARLFKGHGLVRDPESFLIQRQGAWHQEVHSLGLNYRLPDVLAALGISQLSRLTAFKRRRAIIFARYVQGLEGVDGLRLPSVRSYVDPMWHLFPLRVEPQRRRRIFDFLRSRGVAVQVNYMPIYWHPVYANLGYKRGACPVAERYFESEISLPMFADLGAGDQNRVIDLVKEAVKL